MIVKDEEELLPDCLESIKDFVDEIVIVDTGSTDRTKEIAKSYGAKIFDQPWQDNFSLHRNQSIAYATSKWIFIIDADERLDKDYKDILHGIKRGDVDAITLSVCNVYPGQVVPDGAYGQMASIRLFKKATDIHYEGPIHNRLASDKTVPSYKANVNLYHYGYSLSPEKMKIKFDRERKILAEELAKNPDDFKYHFEMARSLMRNEYNQLVEDNFEEALVHCNRVMELTGPYPQTVNQWSIRVMSLSQMTQMYLHSKDYDNAIKYGTEAYELHPEFLDPMFMLGAAYLNICKYSKAIMWFQRYLEVRKDYGQVNSADTIISVYYENRYLAYMHLGSIYHRMGRVDKAEAYHAEAMKYRPVKVKK